jgi:hypothetical protein
MEENIGAQMPKRNTPRDLFLHLLAVVTLYWSAVTFVALLWQYINKIFPDVLRYYERFNEPMRFAISSLIIVFPVFLLVSRYLNKIYAREAVVRESKIRKWLIYLTLFIAALVIIVDLVTVINTFLNEGLTAKFILKALSVLIVAAVIFWYYLDDVRRDTPTKLAKPLAWATSVIILIAIIGAFFIVGSPATARLENFDMQKVNDLQEIQYQIVNYYQSKGYLPANLAVLEDPISGFKVPVDPQSGTSYEYSFEFDNPKLEFELCATFNKPTQRTSSKGVMYNIVPSDVNQNWNHEAGRVCFDRTIDKEIYRVKK